MRPRKLFALLNVHYDIKRREYGQAPNSDKAAGQTTGQVVDGYIDTIPGW